MVMQGQRSPLTEYFFWPRRDAWEELKTSLETRDWISDRQASTAASHV
jgi:30S ribosomal protein 3